MPSNEATFGDTFDFYAGPDDDFLAGPFGADAEPPVRPAVATPRFKNDIDQSFGYPEETVDPEPAPDPLDIDENECRVQVAEPVHLLSNQLWTQELFFGRAIRIHRDLVEEAIEAFPQHDMAVKRWWKVYQKIRGKPSFDTGSFAGANKHSLLEDALKFDRFYSGELSSMTLQLGNRIFQLITNSGEDVPPRLSASRRKFSTVHAAAEIDIGERGVSPFSGSWSEHHTGEIYAISAIIAGGEIVAAGPLNIEAKLAMIYQGGSFQVTKIDLNGAESKDHTFVNLMDPARRRNTLIETEALAFEIGSTMHARFAEAAAFYGEGNRSIIQSGIVISDTYVSFIKPSHNFFSRQKIEMHDVSFAAFEQQVNLIEAEGTRRAEQKLVAACRNFLGERPGEALGVEEQAILDALYELMRPEYVTNGVQSGWDQLSRRGMNVYTALSRIEDKWGITLMEEPWPDNSEATTAAEQETEAA
jgi:hypothetical protein